MTPNPAAPKLPIGLQDFPTLIERGYQYVDKTEQIYGLVNKGEMYFLSRPRRFGKSLLVSTLQALFEGHRELFKGLWIDQREYDWPVHPVVRLDMSDVDTDTPAVFRQSLIKRLVELGQLHGLQLTGIDSPKEGLRRLIVELAQSKEPVVVLVDEYDKPLLDVMHDPERVHQLRDELRQFYISLKSQQASLRFVFLTGVSKFSQVSVFSGLNNLRDISLDTRFDTLLGYTQSELETYFAPCLTQLAKHEGLSSEALLAKVKYWYNGYRFSQAASSVYNPFSTLLLFDTLQFQPHWFETGTPTFLTQWLAQTPEEVPSLEHCEVEASDFISMPLEEMELIPLLYQTGYLTIKGYEASIDRYVLGYPNEEVRRAFTRQLLKQLLPLDHWRREQARLGKMVRCLLVKDYEGWMDQFNALLACVPYSLQDKKEKYAKSLFYLAHLVGGLSVQAETHTHRGQTDVVIETSKAVWVIEFKVDKSPQVAMEQIKAKDYPAKYQVQGRCVILVGLNYNSQLRQMDGWLVENKQQ